MQAESLPVSGADKFIDCEMRIMQKSESELRKRGQQILRNHAIARQRMELNKARDDADRMERERQSKLRSRDTK